VLGREGNGENNDIFTYKPGIARMWHAAEYGLTASYLLCCVTLGWSTVVCTSR
jgi:hypothetical protein